jgi:soluble P-type ATPase
VFERENCLGISVDVPGYGALQIKHILFDLNGTLARDGVIADSTRERLQKLAEHMTLYVMSADTHGTLEQSTTGLPIQVRRVRQELGATEKLDLLNELGAEHTVAVGNGRNDVEMLAAAALGIAILGPEGAAQSALLAADLFFSHIDDALDSLLNPKRLIATLRG